MEAVTEMSKLYGFAEQLLKDQLKLPPSIKLQSEREHCILILRPLTDASTRSVKVKLSSHRLKEEICGLALQK